MYDQDQELCGLPAQNRHWLNSLINGLKEVITLNSVIIFGSRAEGAHTVWSDYDLCIISSSFKGMNKWKRAELVLSKWAGERALEPICYTKEEMETSTFTLADEIMNKGKVIYDDNTFQEIVNKKAKQKRKTKNDDLRSR